MESKTLLIIGIIVLLLASLVCYILGRVKLRRGEIFLVINGWDVALLLVSAASLFLAYFNSGGPKIETIVFLSLGGAALLGTVVMSVVHNWGYFWNMVVSVLAKVLMVFLSMLAIPVIALTSFVISIIALVSRDFDLFEILNFKWLFKLIYGPRKTKLVELSSE